jgi:hypothetical protein
VQDPDRIARRHLFLGWTALLVYLIFGLFLEMLHGFKAGFYLDVGNETRRLMWRLAHAHGTLLALVNVAYGLTVKAVPEASDRLASVCLSVALVLVPLGFFLGGIVTSGGDPGAMVFVVPPGAVALAIGTGIVARALVRRKRDE